MKQNYGSVKSFLTKCMYKYIFTRNISLPTLPGKKKFNIEEIWREKFSPKVKPLQLIANKSTIIIYDLKYTMWHLICQSLEDSNININSGFNDGDRRCCLPSYHCIIMVWWWFIIPSGASTMIVNLSGFFSRPHVGMYRLSRKASNQFHADCREN